MVVISHNYKFIIIKSYKTGSTTVELIFKKILKNLYDSKSSGDLIIGKCEKLNISSHIIPDRLFQMKPQLIRYYKICTIRNPFYQIVSSYIYKNKTIPTSDELFHYIHKINKEKKNFTIRPYISFKNKPIINYYIKIENLKENILNLLLKLNIDTNYFKNKICKNIPHLRKSEIKYDIRKIYNKKCINLVEKYYDLELKLGNYTFPTIS